MNKKTDKTKFWLNLIGLSSAIALVTGLLFYQVFVLPNYQPVSFSYWLKPGNLKNAWYQLTHHQVLPLENYADDFSALKVICQPDCFFQLNHMQIPAIVSQDASARLKQLDLKFFDQDHGLIGYQSLDEYPVFYVINLKADLLQTIQLDLNHQVEYQFVRYYPDSQQMLFSSDGSDYLYSAVKPELLDVTGEI